MQHLLVLDALMGSALILILHDAADQLVILLQEPLDCLLIYFRLASHPVGYESHRHPAKPGGKPSSDSTNVGATKL